METKNFLSFICYSNIDSIEYYFINTIVKITKVYVRFILQKI